MKWKTNPTARKFCYGSDCKVVTIGFRWSDNYACKTCGQEITEDLYKRLKDREEKDNRDDEELERLWNEQSF